MAFALLTNTDESWPYSSIERREAVLLRNLVQRIDDAMVLAHFAVILQRQLRSNEI
jgi:hypothetical protein